MGQGSGLTDPGKPWDKPAPSRGAGLSDLRKPWMLPAARSARPRQYPQVYFPRGFGVSENLINMNKDYMQYGQERGYVTSKGIEPKSYEVFNPSLRGYWENPQRVDRYYNFIRSQPEGFEHPWLDEQRINDITIAHDYLKAKNSGTPTIDWKHLSENDPATSWLRGLEMPPMEFMFPEEVQEEVEKAKIATWDELYPFQQAFQTIASPQPFGAFSDDPSERPEWSKGVANTIRSGISGIAGAGLGSTITAGAAAAASAIFGSAAGTAMVGGSVLSGGTLPIALGLTFFLGAAYQSSTGKELPVVGKLLKAFDVVNIFSQGTEQAIGTAEQLLDDDTKQVIENLDAAWQASYANYETNEKSGFMNAWVKTAKLLGMEGATDEMVADPGEVYRWDLGIAEPVKLPEGINTGVQALHDIRTAIENGADPEQAAGEYMAHFGVQGYMNDFLLQNLLDPMNFAPSITQGIGAALAKKSGDVVRIAAFKPPTVSNVVVDALPMPINYLVTGLSGGRLKGSGGLIENIRVYQNFVETGLFPGQKGYDDFDFDANYSQLNRLAGDLTEEGMPKWFEPARKADEYTGLFPNIRRGLDWLGNKTPKTKALISYFNLTDHLDNIVRVAGDNVGMAAKIMISATKADPKLTGEALKKILRPGGGEENIYINPQAYVSPIGSALGTGLRDIDAQNKIQDFYVNNWVVPTERRAYLFKVAKALGIKPGDVLDNLSRGFDVGKTLKEKGVELGIKDFEAVNTKQLNALFKVFSGDDPMPYVPKEFIARMGLMVKDSLQDFVVKRFGLKPDSAFYRVAHILKGMQSLVVLGFNPGYLLNNTLGNFSSRAANGLFGFMSHKQIDGLLSRLEINPNRYDLGFDENSRVAQDLGIDPDGKVNKIFAAVRGEKDLINSVSHGVNKLNESIGIFSRLSGIVERNESKQAFTIATRYMMSNLWKRGVGIRQFPDDVAAKLGKELTDKLYSLAESSLNNGELEMNFYKQGSKPSILGMMDKITESLVSRANVIPGEADVYRDLLVKSGILDDLDQKLQGAKNIEDVHQVFTDVGDTVDTKVREMVQHDLVVRAESIKNKVQVEGLTAAMSEFIKIEMQFMRTWIQHFNDLEDLFSKQPNMGKDEFSALYKLQRDKDDMRFSDLFAWEAETKLGVLEALGYSMDNPQVKAIVESNNSRADVWREFYKTKREKYEQLLDQSYANDDAYQTALGLVRTEVAEEYDAISDFELALMKQADEGFIALSKNKDLARKWREGVYKIREDMISRMKEFRQKLRDNPPADVIEKNQLWSEFIKEEYIPRIVALKNAEAQIESIKQSKKTEYHEWEEYFLNNALDETVPKPLADAIRNEAEGMISELEEGQAGRRLAREVDGQGSDMEWSAEPSTNTSWYVKLFNEISGTNKETVANALKKIATGSKAQNRFVEPLKELIVHRLIGAEPRGFDAGSVAKGNDVPEYFYTPEPSAAWVLGYKDVAGEYIGKELMTQGTEADWVSAFPDPVQRAEVLDYYLSHFAPKNEIKVMFMETGKFAEYEIDTIMAMMDFRAENWATQTGKTPGEYYANKLEKVLRDNDPDRVFNALDENGLETYKPPVNAEANDMFEDWISNNEYLQPSDPYQYERLREVDIPDGRGWLMPNGRTFELAPGTEHDMYFYDGLEWGGIRYNEGGDGISIGAIPTPDQLEKIVGMINNNDQTELTVDVFNGRLYMDTYVLAGVDSADLIHQFTGMLSDFESVGARTERMVDLKNDLWKNREWGLNELVSSGETRDTWYYHEANRVVDGMPKRMTKDQFWNYIKKKVKKAELESTGMDAWLKQWDGKWIYKEDAQNFLRTHNYENDTIVLGDNPYKDKWKKAYEVELADKKRLNDFYMQSTQNTRDLYYGFRDSVLAASNDQFHMANSIELLWNWSLKHPGDVDGIMSKLPAKEFLDRYGIDYKIVRDVAESLNESTMSYILQEKHAEKLARLESKATDQAVHYDDNSYVFPGGENYRELLNLQGEVKKIYPKSELEAMARAAYPEGAKDMADDVSYYDNLEPHIKEQVWSMVQAQDKSNQARQYKGGHWTGHGYPDVLSHVRFVDRWMSGEGDINIAPVQQVKALAVDEFQSDITNDARRAIKQGQPGYDRHPEVEKIEAQEYYRQVNEFENKIKELQTKADDLLAKRNSWKLINARREMVYTDRTTGEVLAQLPFFGGSETSLQFLSKRATLELTYGKGNIQTELVENPVNPNYRKVIEAFAKRSNDIWDEIHTLRMEKKDYVAKNVNPLNTGSMGAAPYTPHTDWGLHAMKRMVHFAVEQGYDRFMWTQGDSHNKRWNLAVFKQVDKVSYNESTKNFLGFKDGSEVINKQVEPGELQDWIGRERTQRLTEADVDDGGYKSLAGEAALAEGGEGKRILYDKIMVKAAEKILKEYGIEVTKFQTGDPDGKVSNPDMTLQEAIDAGLISDDQSYEYMYTVSDVDGNIFENFADYDDAQRFWQDEYNQWEREKRDWMEQAKQESRDYAENEAYDFVDDAKEFEDRYGVTPDKIDEIDFDDYVWDDQETEYFFKEQFPDHADQEPYISDPNEIFDPMDFPGDAGSIEYWGFDITAEMRDKIMREGMPLFEIKRDVVDLARKHGIPTATKDGNPNDQFLLNIVNKYMGKEYDDIDQVTYQDAKSALEKRARENGEAPIDVEIRRGSTSFQEDGRAIVRAFQAADAITMVHEIGHIFRRDLTGDDLEAVAKWGGLTNAEELLKFQEQFDNGTLSEKNRELYRAAEEKFANGFVKYLTTDRPNLPKVMQSIFKRFAEWLVRLNRNTKKYKDIDIEAVIDVGGKEVKISEVMDRLFTRAEGEQQLDTVPMPDNMGKIQSEATDLFVKPIMESAEQVYVNELNNHKPLSMDDIPEGMDVEINKWLKHLQGDLASTKMTSMKYGENRRDMALLNYSDRTGIEQLLGVPFPYIFYYMETATNLAKNFWESPKLMATYVRYKELQEKMEREGIPNRLQGKIRLNAPYLPDWMGNSLWQDPFNAIFPTKMFDYPLESAKHLDNNVKHRTYDTLDALAENGTISQEEADQAKTAESGETWDMAKGIAAQELGTFDPVSLASIMATPAMYLSAPYNLLTDQADKISPTPMMKTAQAIQGVTQDTALAGIGKVLGSLGKPEEALRSTVMTPGKAAFGEWGDYKIDRQLANMVADGEITSEQAKLAMIERDGDVYADALNRVRQEVAMRIPGSAPLMAVTHGAKPKEILASLFHGMFPSGLLPKGELEYYDMRDEYEDAWSKYNKGYKEALSDFYDENPVFEARIALHADPEERLHQFLVSQVWDRYMNLEGANRKTAADQLGQEFKDKFLEKSTRDTDSIPTEMIAQWAYVLGGLVPGVEESKSKEIQLEQFGKETAAAYDLYKEERNERFPNYYGIQDMVYKGEGTPDMIRRNKEYKEWNDQYKAEHPEIQPVLAYYKASFNEPPQITDEAISSMPDELTIQLRSYALTGRNLGAGAWEALSYVWEKAGKPYGALSTWVDVEILPSFR